MAKLFIGIALALMLATAALGFLAKGNIDTLKRNLGEKKTELEGKKQDLRKAEEGLTTAKAELETANGKAEEARKNLEAKTKEYEDANTKLTAANTALDTKNKEATDLQTQLDELKKGAKPGVPMVEDPRIAAMTADLQKAQAELAEQKALVEATIKKGEADALARAELEKKEKQRAMGITRPGLTGKILAVNGGWNFVVISVGDKQGVMVNSPLLVIRGNTPVARLRITSVEPSTSIADVIPGSVARGVTVQPGDTVIFEATRSEGKPAGEAETSTTPPLPAR